VCIALSVSVPATTFEAPNRKPHRLALLFKSLFCESAMKKSLVKLIIKTSYLYKAFSFNEKFNPSLVIYYAIIVPVEISTTNIEKPRLIETIFGIVYNGNSVNFIYNFVKM